MSVRIGEVRCMNMSWNLNIFSGPKASLRCGACRHCWSERLPKMNYPSLKCPGCGVVNDIPITYVSGGA